MMEARGGISAEAPGQLEDDACDGDGNVLLDGGDGPVVVPVIAPPPPDVHDFLVGWFDERDVQRLYVALARPPPTTARANTLRVSAAELARRLAAEMPPVLAGCVAPHAEVDDVVTVPTLGPVRRCAGAHPRVWLDRRCGEAVLRGAHVFAPGVTAMEHSVRRGTRVALFVDVHAQITKGSVRKEGDPGVYVGNGVAQLQRSDLFHRSLFETPEENTDAAGTHRGAKKRGGVAIVVDEAIYIAPPLRDVMSDLMYLQNLPSIVTSHVLDPQPGERVLDLCSSPGGKTTHIATLMRDRGEVVAFDRNLAKVQPVRDAARRLGVHIVRAYRCDATRYRDFIAEGDEDELVDGEGLPRFGRESFDRVLLDPPCSALGIRPRLCFDAELAVRGELERKARFQRVLMRAAAMLLKPGGVMVFSTCTINPIENEMNVKYALDSFPLRLEAAKLRLGACGVANAGLDDEQRRLVQRFNPWDERDTAGFFCARFRKTDRYR